MYFLLSNSKIIFGVYFKKLYIYIELYCIDFGSSVLY